MRRGQERLLDVARSAEAVDRGPGTGVALLRFVGKLLEADAADRRRGAGEVLVDEALLEPDGLEDLRRVVGGDRRDAHLREHLEEAGAERLDESLLGRVRVEVGDLAARRKVADSVEHEIGVDRRCAVADQRGDVVDLARLACLDREARANPVAGADEVLVDGRGRE